jgi:glycosyltransferase involved in cell wall biosynthesis
LQRYLEDKYRRPVDYVPTGVRTYDAREPDEIRKWGLDKDNYILFLSRLVPEKGCHYLIEAYERLGTDKRLVIAGPPAPGEEAYLARLTQTTNPNVIFTGAVMGPLLEELFSNAYVYVVPSEVEGLSHALLQGLSFGRCVLASDIDANLEALGACGVTFKSQDVDDLQQKLQHLLNNPELVRGCTATAQARVRELYTWDRVVDRLEAIYAGLCPALMPETASSVTH